MHFPWSQPSRLEQRADAAAKQMRYFHIFTQRGRFEDLVPSADRAGFVVGHRDSFRKAVTFYWRRDSKPDFGFHVSFDDTLGTSVTAEAYGDIFGVIMVGHADQPIICVAIKPAVTPRSLGRHARSFQKLLLAQPGFGQVKTASAFDGYVELGKPRNSADQYRQYAALGEAAITPPWRPLRARIAFFANILATKAPPFLS